jgi:hypothetical protein
MPPLESVARVASNCIPSSSIGYSSPGFRKDLVMRYRVLIVGMDVDLLMIRQVLLTSWGYDSLIATPEDVDEKLKSGRFDLVILSLMLGQEEKRQIQAKLPAGTRPLMLQTLVWPDELRRTVAEALA